MEQFFKCAALTPSSYFHWSDPCNSSSAWPRGRSFRIPVGRLCRRENRGTREKNRTHRSYEKPPLRDSVPSSDTRARTCATSWPSAHRTAGCSAIHWATRRDGICDAIIGAVTYKWRNWAKRTRSYSSQDEVMRNPIQLRAGVLKVGTSSSLGKDSDPEKERCQRSLQACKQWVPLNPWVLNLGTVNPQRVCEGDLKGPWLWFKGLIGFAELSITTTMITT